MHNAYMMPTSYVRLFKYGIAARMDVSVIIPTHNRCETLARTLLLYNAQKEMRGRFEVIVSDDGSTDATQARVETLSRNLDYPLHYLRHSPNRGPSAARNRAIERAAGDVLLFTGDDIFPAPDFLHQHWLWHTERYPQAQAGMLGRLAWAEELHPTPFMHWLNDCGSQFSYGKIHHDEELEYGHLHTANVSVKRRLLAETGEHFDERLRICEDSEWAARLAAKGMRLYYNADAFGEHLHETTLASSLRRMESVGAALQGLREISPDNYHRATHGLFTPAKRMKLRLLRWVLHPRVSNWIYEPIARWCERRLIADRVYALCHAAHLLKGLQR